jgi:DNA-binding SARP family transcriptional activator/tetratricopeptide (TPR) repeat protein
MEIRLLGELDVVDDGRTLPLPPSKKTRALLAFLAATGEAHPRQRLCDLLFDGPDDPRAGLRWSLTKLRGAIDAKCIATTGDHVRVDAIVDLARHRQETSTGIASLDVDALTRAATRFRGEFLEGLDLPDCHRFDEWCVGQREALRRDRVALLVALVDRLRDRPDDALRWARARVAVDPLAEVGHVALVELLARLGRRREAMEQVDRCKRILASELSMQPSIALEKARMAIGTTPVSIVAEPQRKSIAPAPAPAIEGGDRTPMLGREDERRTFASAIEAARRDESTTPFLVVGEPGMGKTRLVDDLVSRVRAEGGLALVGRAFEAEMVRPYGAFVDALRSIPLRDAELAVRDELSTLLPEISDSPVKAIDRSHLFDAVRRLLAGLAARSRPVIVVLDDVQWLDEASAAIVHYVARDGVPGAMLAMAARPGELEDNAAALRLVRALRRAGRLRELPLAPLSSEETRALVRWAAPSVDAARVARGSEGNPLFALELGRAMARGDAEEIPETLEGLLRERLERLDERAQIVVGWAATLGRSFELTHLTEVAELPTTQLLSIVEELERRGLLRSAPAGGTQFGYDFAHDLLRRAAYRRLSAPRRRLSHAHVARVLGARMTTEDALAGDVAHHAALAGDDDVAARACALGSRRCVRIFAYAEAIELADRGLRHVRKLDADAALALEVELLAVHVEAGSIRRGDELERALQDVIARSERANRLDLTSLALRALGIQQHHRGAIVRSAASLDRAATIGRGGDPHKLVESLANAGRCYAMVGKEIARARSLIAEAESMADRHGVKHPEIAFGRACLAAYDGGYDDAMRLFAETLLAVRAKNDHWRECECLMRMTIAHVDRGEWKDADARAAELAAVAQKMGDGGSEVQVAEALSALSAFGGGDRDARPSVERALGKLRDVDTKGMLGYVLACVATVELDDGDVVSAAAHADASLEMARALEAEDDTIAALALSATVAATAGELDRARERLAEASTLDGRYGSSARARRALQRARETLQNKGESR